MAFGDESRPGKGAEGGNEDNVNERDIRSSAPKEEAKKSLLESIDICEKAYERNNSRTELRAIPPPKPKLEATVLEFPQSCLSRS